MKRLRRQVVFLACWLVGFFSVEQLLEPIHINSATIIYIFSIMIVVLVTPRFGRVPLWALLAAPIPVFLAIKHWVNQIAGNVAILLTIAEVGAVVFTTYLAYLVSMTIYEFENAVSHITVGQPKRITENAPLVAGILFREVRRARNHQRPLSLMALAIDEKLEARVRALLRRSNGTDSRESGRIYYADSVLDVDIFSKTVKILGQVVELSPKEYSLLASLVRERGKIVSHRELVREVWGEYQTNYDSIVSLYVCYLRKKLKDGQYGHEYIRTNWGRGYWFEGRIEELV